MPMPHELLFVNHLAEEPCIDGSTRRRIKQHVMRDIGLSRRRPRNNSGKCSKSESSLASRKSIDTITRPNIQHQCHRANSVDSNHSNCTSASLPAVFPEDDCSIAPTPSFRMQPVLGLRPTQSLSRTDSMVDKNRDFNRRSRWTVDIRQRFTLPFFCILSSFVSSLCFYSCHNNIGQLTDVLQCKHIPQIQTLSTL